MKKRLAAPLLASGSVLLMALGMTAFAGQQPSQSERIAKARFASDIRAYEQAQAARAAFQEATTPCTETAAQLGHAHIATCRGTSNCRACKNCKTGLQELQKL